MYPPATELQLKPENLQSKEKCPLYPCDLFDTEVSHKIARFFLPGLASASIDSTAGGLYSSPESVAINIRKEMVEYLTQRSENFVAESVISDPEAPEQHPYDIISEFVDDFVRSKMNFLTGVSIWLLSEQREERIDDFVEELETNRFWLIERRESLALTLIKNVDYKHAFHCDMKFNSETEHSIHIQQCSFRTMDCMNEGCNGKFTASRLEKHDSMCPFKLLPCEQKCLASVTRREMDRHCVTVCPMKLVNCPFYQVNCRSTIPRCEVERHNFENLRSHILNVLGVIHKGVSVEDLEERVKRIEKASSLEQLAKSRDARSLMMLIKGLEAKLGPLEMSSKINLSKDSSAKQEEQTELPREKENVMDSPTKSEEFADSQA